MLLEASEEAVEGNWDGGRIVWSVRYAFDNGSQLNGMDQLQQRLQQRQMQPHHHHHHAERRKLQVRLEIQKDDIQAVLPISKVTRSNSVFPPILFDNVAITKITTTSRRYTSFRIPSFSASSYGNTLSRSGCKERNLVWVRFPRGEEDKILSQCSRIGDVRVNREGNRPGNAGIFRNSGGWKNG